MTNVMTSIFSLSICSTGTPYDVFIFAVKTTVELVSNKDLAPYKETVDPGILQANSKASLTFITILLISKMAL